MPKACCTLSHINCGLAKKESSNTVLRSRKLRANNIRNPRYTLRTVDFTTAKTKTPFAHRSLWFILRLSRQIVHPFSSPCTGNCLFLPFFRRKVFSMLPIFHPRPEPEREKRHIVSVGKLCWFWEIKFHKKVCFHEAHLRYTVLPSSLSSITGDTNVVGSSPIQKTPVTDRRTSGTNNQNEEILTSSSPVGTDTHCPATLFRRRAFPLLLPDTLHPLPEQAKAIHLFRQCANRDGFLQPVRTVVIGEDHPDRPLWIGQMECQKSFFLLLQRVF